MLDLSARFPRYLAHDPAVPVWCVSPEGGPTTHRFFDTSPVSPSGRYIGLTRLPYEGRPPTPGDPAEVLVVDLVTGAEHVVAETRGWDTQLGAGVQWGADDRALVYNDLDTTTWRPYAVVLDPATGVRRRLRGPVYMLSPDGRQALSPDLVRIARAQAGYGVVVPEDRVPANTGAPEDDGLYLTDVETGACRLLASLERIVEACRLPRTGSQGNPLDCYGFHAKWNPQGDRIMFVVRAKPRGQGPERRAVVTMRADGSEMHVAISPDQWAPGGHHPNWLPDGERLLMNLNLRGEGMLLVSTRYDGSDLGPMTEAVPGSGHPSLHPDGRHVLTDAYTHEPLAYGDGTTPLRLIDLQRGEERTLARIRTLPDDEGPGRMWRVDPHPAWDRSFRWAAFNACPDGVRRVYLADLSELVAPADGASVEGADA